MIFYIFLFPNSESECSVLQLQSQINHTVLIVFHVFSAFNWLKKSLVATDSRLRACAVGCSPAGGDLCSTDSCPSGVCYRTRPLSRTPRSLRPPKTLRPLTPPSASVISSFLSRLSSISSVSRHCCSLWTNQRSDLTRQSG